MITRLASCMLHRFGCWNLMFFELVMHFCAMFIVIVFSDTVFVWFFFVPYVSAILVIMYLSGCWRWKWFWVLMGITGVKVVFLIILVTPMIMMGRL